MCFCACISSPWWNRVLCTGKSMLWRKFNKPTRMTSGFKHRSLCTSVHSIWCVSIMSCDVKMLRLGSSEGWRIPPTGRDQTSGAGEANVGEGEEGDRWDAGEGEGEESQGESPADRTGEVSRTTKNNNNNLKKIEIHRLEFLCLRHYRIYQKQREEEETQREQQQRLVISQNDFFFFFSLKDASWFITAHWSIGFLSFISNLSPGWSDRMSVVNMKL